MAGGWCHTLDAVRKSLQLSESTGFWLSATFQANVLKVPVRATDGFPCVRRTDVPSSVVTSTLVVSVRQTSLST